MASADTVPAASITAWPGTIFRSAQLPRAPLLVPKLAGRTRLSGSWIVSALLVFLFCRVTGSGLGAGSGGAGVPRGVPERGTPGCWGCSVLALAAGLDHDGDCFGLGGGAVVIKSS